MPGASFFEILVVVLTVVSGGLGIPLGMPPGPEDPMLGRFADNDAQIHFAWTGLGENTGDDPTSKWMAKPKIQAAVTKLKKGLAEHLDNKADAKVTYRRGSRSLLQRVLMKTAEVSIYNGASVYATDVEFGQQVPVFKAAMLIPLGDRKIELEQLVTELRGLLGEEEKGEEEKSPFEVIEKDGLTRIRIEEGTPEPVEFLIKDGYLVLGFGEGMLDQGLANMQTEPPKWFTEYRKRLAVKKFSSMAYLSGKCLDNVNFATEAIRDLKSLTDLCFVCGLDDEGFVTRTAIDLEPDSPIEKLLPLKPLKEHELARMTKRPLVGFQSRVPVEEVVEYIANVGKKIGDDPVAEAEERFEELFGLSLQEELLNVFDGFASVSFDFNLAGTRPFITVALGISDEMSFPAVYETVVETISQWPEVADRLETSEHREFKIYEFTPPPMMFFPVKYCWAHANDQLIFGSEVDLVADQIDRMLDGDTFADTQRAKQLIEFGKEYDFGNPVAVTTLDPAKVMELVLQVVDMFGNMDDDEELFPGFTFGDIPDIEVLSGGVDSSVTGIYRTPQGFQGFGRHTLPGSSPPVTMLMVGGLSFGQVADDKVIARPAKSETSDSLRQILLACLNFEAAYMKFPAAGTKDADGKPLLSWRVHILPFLDQSNLRDQFHLDEPWDSEHNKTLIEKMPKIYCHPDMKATDGKTVFLGIAGEDGMLGTPQLKTSGEVGFADITDGSSNTALAVAVEASSAVIWSKPDDLNADDGEKVVEATDENEDGTTVGLVDGSVRVFEDLDGDTWELLMKISDGQVIDIDALAK